MLVDEKIENKSEEKPNKDLEVAEKILQPSKKSLSWTPERKKAQALRMAKIIGSGKAYSGKKQKNTEKIDDDKTDSSEATNSDASPPDSDSLEDESVYEKSNINPVLIMIIIIFAVLFGLLVFFKEAIIKFIFGDNNDER